MADGRFNLGGFTGRGYFALLAALFGLIGTVVSVVFVNWVEDRVELATHLWSTGARAAAHDAVVYRCPGRCADDFVAVIEFPEGPERLEIADVDFERDGLAEGRWWPAPAPYDGTFAVLYDPADRAALMTETDADAFQSITVPRAVTWFLGTWTAAWLWPAIVATRTAVRRDRASRNSHP